MKIFFRQFFKAMFVLFIFFLLGMGFFVWMRFIEPSLVKVERISLEINDFPLEKLRVLHLSDLHTKEITKKEKDILKIIERENPDFIFLTGDMVDWQTEDLDSVSWLWQGISEGRGGRVFGVYGNHEHRNPKFKEIKVLLKESGIEILDNEWKKVEVGDRSFYLIGLDDPHLGFDKLDLAMEGLPEGGSRIMLAHSPEVFRKVILRQAQDDAEQGRSIKNKDIDLVLVGHTHGCQINLPFLCDWILPVKYDKQYKSGLFQEQGTYLYVNRGLGETFLPLRFNSFPEATLIEITP